MVTYSQELMNSLKRVYKIKLIKTSYSGVRPGDIVSVRYLNKDRVGFIMSSKRTSDGSFIPIKVRNNDDGWKRRLLNFVDAESINGEDFLEIVDKLYTEDLRPIVSDFDYYVAQSGLESLDVTTNFRTLAIQELSGQSLTKIVLLDRIE